MTNLKRLSISNATFFILEGELINVNDGQFPVTYLGLRFQDAPDEQVWILDDFYLGFFDGEGSVVSSHELVQNKIAEIKSNRVIDLTDGFSPISNFEEDYLPYGSRKTIIRSSIQIVKTI